MASIIETAVASASHSIPHRVELMRSVKIIATLGPAVGGQERLGQLIDSGIDVARINCAHGTLEERATFIRDLRAAADERDKYIPVLMDLRGLKLRTGPLAGDDAVFLARGSQVHVYPGSTPTMDGQLSVNYPNLLNVMYPGERVLLADGLIELFVEDINEDCMICSVGRGGPLASGQGVTLPNVQLQDAAVTEYDKADIQFAAEHDVEYIGLSFISTAADVETARDVARKFGGNPGIVAKIERPYALNHIDAIARAADAVMVARGDLGVQLPPEQVPRVQKDIIELCNLLGTPVITATQMLESMIMQPVPTRAETSDVANAVYDGSDAVMLSAETATGRHPFAAVRMMDRIVREAEKDGPIRPRGIRQADPTENAANATVAALGRAAQALSDTTPVEMIVVFTMSGASALLVARSRPGAPVIAITTEPFVARQLSLYWGVTPLVRPLNDNLEELLDESTAYLLEKNLITPGSDVLFVGSLPIYRVSGRTNLLHVRTIGKDDEGEEW